MKIKQESSAFFKDVFREVPHKTNDLNALIKTEAFLMPFEVPR